MAQLGMTFTADPNAPKASFDTLPPGEYVAQIVDSEIKTVGAGGTGLMISLTWEIMEGPNKGRRIWQNINYKNDSEKAQKIGLGQLNDIQVALNVAAIEDTVQLHMKPARIKLKITPAKGEYSERNDVSAVNPWTPGAPLQQGQAAAPASAQQSAFANASPPPPPAQDDSKPWG